MEYYYPAATLPCGRLPSDSYLEAASVLHRKITSIDLSTIGLSEYNQGYLQRKLKAPIAMLQLYVHLLSLSTIDTEVSLEDFVLIDYGGGSGMISLLAKEIGVGTVVYCDIYKVSCEDIGKLSKAMGSNIDHVVCGDVDALVEYVQRNQIQAHAITSYDVIEHIYDIESYLKKIAEISTPGQRLVFGSGANIRNPLVRFRLGKRHHTVEFLDRKPKWGHKDRDSLRSYLAIRESIIQSYDSSLSHEQIENLAVKTRGLIKDDIERCVDEYRQTGSVSYVPDHPSNTCDPNTGNWEEHLIETHRFETTLSQVGFSVRILSGYYARKKQFLRSLVRKVLNVVIRIFGRKALAISPYYIVVAHLKPDEKELIEE